MRGVSTRDISAAALKAAKARLGKAADRARWVVADLTTWRPEPAAYDLWRGRATFHFLSEERDRPMSRG